MDKAEHQICVPVYQRPGRLSEQADLSGFLFRNDLRL